MKFSKIFLFLCVFLLGGFVLLLGNSLESLVDAPSGDQRECVFLQNAAGVEVQCDGTLIVSSSIIDMEQDDFSQLQKAFVGLEVERNFATLSRVDNTRFSTNYKPGMVNELTLLQKYFSEVHCLNSEESFMAGTAAVFRQRRIEDDKYV